MKDKSLVERLIYLDAEFISRVYEAERNISPTTRITRTQSMQAAASLALFSGGGSSSESRAFEISTLQMLDELMGHLGKYPNFENFSLGDASGHFWVEGTLTASKVKLTRSTGVVTVVGAHEHKPADPTRELIGEEAFFTIKANNGKFALAPTDQYFVSGVATFKGLTHLVVDQMSLPCRSLLRVFSARTAFKQWVATPLVILDREGG